MLPVQNLPVAPHLLQSKSRSPGLTGPQASVLSPALWPHLHLFSSHRVPSSHPGCPAHCSVNFPRVLSAADHCPRVPSAWIPPGPCLAQSVSLYDTRLPRPWDSPGKNTSGFCMAGKCYYLIYTCNQDTIYLYSWQWSPSLKYSPHASPSIYQQNYLDKSWTLYL